MKKNLKKLNVSLMLLLMIFSYLTPIFNLFIVNAESVNTNETIFNGLNEEGKLELDFDDNKIKTITVDSNLYEITSCNASAASGNENLKTTYDENSCTITATNYGVFNLYVNYFDKLTSEYGYKTLLVDVATSEYLQNIIKEIPTILYGENMWDNRIYSLIDEILPDNVRYNILNSEVIDGKRIYTNELIYTYTIYDESYEYPENIEIKEQFTTEVRDYIGIPNFYLGDLNVGDEAEISFNGKTVEFDDYIFVSMDRSILTVNEKGKVNALTPGETFIRIYDKETLKYIEREIRVNGAKRSYEEVKESFPSNIEFSVNEIDMVMYDENYNVTNEREILNSYFYNYFYENLGYQHGFNINEIILNNNTCTINYNYNFSDSIFKENESITFNYNFSGIYFNNNSMSSEYKNTFYYKTIGNEKVASINVDSNYLKQVSPDTDREFVKNNESMNLGNLRVDGYFLDSKFDPYFSYLSVTLPPDVEEITVIAEPESDNVIVEYYLDNIKIDSLENIKLNPKEENSYYYNLMIKIISKEYPNWWNEYNLNIYKSNMDFVVYDGLKSGKTNIEFVTDKNIYSHEMYILPKQSEVDSIKEYIDSLLTLEIPYIKYENVSKYIENYLYQKIEDELTIPNIKDELDIDVECFYNNVCSIMVYNQHYGINYKSSTKVTFDTNSTNSNLQLINEFRDNLKDEYYISLEDTIKLENSCNGDKNCFYESLIKEIELPTLSNLKVEYELESYDDFNDLVNGTALFNVKIFDGETKLFDKNITIYTDHVVSLSSSLSDEEKDKIAYLKNEIDSILESDVTLTKLFEDVNIYEVNNKGIKFNVYLDKKERITIKGMNFSTNIYSISSNEELKVEYNKWPVYANYGEIVFKSTDENIFTISEDGVITGHNKGVAYIQAKAGYQTTYAMVLVDIDKKEFLDESLNLIDKHIKIHYSDLNYNTIENAITNRAYQFLYDNFSYVSPQIEVIEENEKYYLVLKIWDDILFDYIKSDRVEVTYELEGIKINEYRNFISSNETIDLGIEFSEGDNNNLVIDVSDDSVVSVTKDGKVTGLKPGIVNIYINDKYYQYYNHVKVYVDYNNYYQQEMSKLKNTVLELDGSKHDMSGYSESISEENLMENIFTNVVYDKVQLYDLVDSYTVECEKDTCTLSFESLVNGEMIEEVFNVKKTGVYINEVIDDFEIGTTKTLNYNVYNTDPSNVTITSLQPDVCSVEDNKVTANDKGICILHYQVIEDGVEKYSKYQGLTVAPKEITLEYQKALDGMNSNITISLPPYVGPETEFDYDYDELYYNVISNAIKEELNIGNDYYINFDVGSLEGESNKINITIHPEAYYYNEDENFHYSIMLNSTDQKEINISYTDVDLEKLEYGKTIVNSLKDKYELTSEQAMRYEMYGDGLEVYEFSDFINELYELDTDITYTASGVGGYGDQDFSTMKYLFTFYKDGDYIGYKGIEFTTRFNIEIGEVASEEEFIEILREEVIDTYKKITTPQTFRMLRSRSLYSSNVEDDIDVTIEKVFDEQLLKPVYNITVEDLSFTAVVNANIIGEQKYTYSVTDIKLDRELYNLKVNDKVTVNYKITPSNATNKEVEWKSSNKNVATVKNGVITAMSAGKAIITISSKDGNCTKTIEVYVTNIIKEDDPVKETTKTGDVNGDNKINMTDIICLRKYFAGLTNLSEKNKLNADINKDGKINMTDIIKLRKYFAGLENL